MSGRRAGPTEIWSKKDAEFSWVLIGQVTETEQICLEIVCNIDRAENNEQVQVFVRNRNKKSDPWLVWIHTVAEDAIQEVAQRKR